MQSISLYPMPWCSQTNAIFAKSQNFTRIKDAQIIDKAFKICRLLPPYWLLLAIRLGLFRQLFWNQGKEIYGKCFCKDCRNIFFPHIMTFTNKCHLCKITKSYVDQECPNRNAAKPHNFTMIKDAKITKLSNIQTVNSISVVTSYHTKAILRIVLKKRKKDWWDMLLERLQPFSLYSMS